MRFIIVIIGPEHLELFALELGKIAEFDFVYTLVSTNINQSVPNLVKINMTIRSHNYVFDYGFNQTRTALELENLPHLTLFTL